MRYLLLVLCLSFAVPAFASDSGDLFGVSPSVVPPSLDKCNEGMTRAEWAEVFGYSFPTSLEASFASNNDVWVHWKSGDWELLVPCCKAELERGSESRSSECQRIYSETRQRHIYLAAHGEPLWMLVDDVRPPSNDKEAREFGFRFVAGSSRWLVRLPSDK